MKYALLYEDDLADDLSGVLWSCAGSISGAGRTNDTEIPSQDYVGNCSVFVDDVFWIFERLR